MNKLIYLAGPYGSPEKQEANVAQAIEFAEKIANLGFYPFVPHFYHWWGLKYEHTYEFWMELDMNWLSRSEGLLRMPGDSPGGDREVKYARSLGLPVFYTIEEMARYYAEGKPLIFGPEKK